MTARTGPLWRDALAEMGLPHTLSPDGPTGGPRRLEVLTAARTAVERLPPPGAPWPERVLHVLVDGVEVLNVHSPIAPSPALAKVRTHEAVAARLAAPATRPRVLCGDLNTPRREVSATEMLTFAHDSNGRLRPERGERWDAAERALVFTLREHGWVDAWRALHGYGERDASWTFPGDKGGWRLDHVLVEGLEVVASAYAHDWRRAGLSDHSALVVDLRERS